MSMPAVRVFSDSNLTVSTALASRDYTRDGSTFHVGYFLKKFQEGYRLGQLFPREMLYYAKKYVTNFVRAAH